MSPWKLVNLYLFSYFLFAVYYYVFSGKQRVLKIYRSLFLAILVLIGIYYAKIGLLRDIVIYPVISIVYFPFMVALNSPNFTFLTSFKFKIYQWGKSHFTFTRAHRTILIKTLIEELVWRSSFIYICSELGFSNTIIIIVGSLLFYLIHLDLSGKIIVLSEVELLIFSFLLYFIFISTESIIVVWIIHFIRNSYLQFIKSDKIKSA